MLDAAGFNNTMILGSDNHWDIADDILKDPDLAKAVSVIGAHFPGTFSTDSAVKTNKTLWASADYSTFNDEVGGGCWARILNQNYVNGLMTATVSWNLIASYYFPLPFYEQGLMTAMEPWSGHYEVKSPIWITAHTTQFTDIGWDYLHHDHGVGLLDNGGSYVALTSPDRKQLTIVIETMTHDHSICIRPGLPSYQVRPQSFSFQLNGSYANIKQLNVWHSKPGFYLKNSTFFIKETPLQVVNGMVSLDVGVDEVITLTTVDTGVKGSYPESPISKSFPLPYTEDFEGYDINGDAYNLAQQTGAFEVVDHNGNKVLQQMVLSQPVINCGVDSFNTSLNLVGSYDWTDISISIDVLVSGVNTTDGVYVGARINLGGCRAPKALGLYFYLYPKEGRFSVFEGFGKFSF
ncbi:galactocerebrosidase [Patella vulgata]|uniref:galactocerebrosidase n=1 Tax=Patella vulgata TaxID=6465 RepID=UPI00217FF173|nr:galactocerebrosidase [Patella vulgata]